MEIEATDDFTGWLADLADSKGKARILARIARIRDHDHFGDSKSVGDGVRELRIKSGPGYRIYFTQRGTIVVVLLCGGDKGSQARDIEKAKALAEGLE